MECYGCSHSDFMPSAKEIITHFLRHHNCSEFSDEDFHRYFTRNYAGFYMFSLHNFEFSPMDLIDSLCEKCSEQSSRWREHVKDAYRCVSRERQLNILRLLRTEFNSLHRRFRRLTARSKFGLKKLRKHCMSPAELLNTGILTSKDILLGNTPASLKELFSFITLSYAMAAVRETRGSVSFSPTVSDFSIWRHSISKESERQTFDELISIMWPDVNAGFHNAMMRGEENGASDGNRDRLDDIPVFDDQIFPGLLNLETVDLLPQDNDSGHFSMLSPETLQDSMHDAASSLFDHSPEDEFDFSAFLNLETYDEPAATQGLPLQSLPSTVADGNGWCNIISPAEEEVREPEPAIPSQLVRNIFFQQVLRFLICKLHNGVNPFLDKFYLISGIVLMQLGVLLMYLSGVDQLSLPKWTEGSTTATTNFSHYVETAKYNILNPLRLNPKFSHLCPLLAVPVKLLRTGWIRSLRDLEEYMIGIARVRP